MLGVDQLEKELKQNNPLNSIYLLYGEEKFLLENSLTKIKKLFGELTKGINYIVLENENIKNIISDIETPAFGYEKKLIIVKNSELFKRGGKRKNTELSDLKDRLENYIKENIDNINQDVVIVFVEENAEKNSLYNLIDKLGIICEFNYQKPLQLQTRIKAICNAYKVNIDNSTLKYFIEACGNNMQVLINEIRKLIEYAGENGTIKKDDIDKLSIKQIESIIFDLTDNLGKKEINMSLQVLHNLIYSKEPIQKILITLYNHFKKLYFVKLALKENMSVEQVLNLKSNQMFLINKYKNQARFFKMPELRNLLQELINLDYKYKVGLIDVEVGLESILCTYCS